MGEKKFQLSKRKKRWAQQFKPEGAARGAALNHPTTLEIRYTKGVQRIINAVIRETQKEVREIFATPDATGYFAEDASFTSIANKSLDALFKRLGARTQIEAEKLARKMVKGANKASQASMAGSLKELSGGVTLKPSEMGGDIAEILASSIEANAGLIVDITATYQAKVSDAVNRSIQSGRGLADLIPFMRDQTGVTKRHGKNVALDQTRKAFTSLNVARMENVGLSKFEWIHSGGGQRPRKYHLDRWPQGLNGGIFDIHDPPFIDPPGQKTRERGLPADAIFCKCRMRPVLVFDEETAA